MEQTEFQRRVTDAIMEREVSEVTAQLSDSENLVIIELKDTDAAFTGIEARQFVAAIEQSAWREGWEEEIEDFLQYVLDLADVVENKRPIEDVAEEWDVDVNS